MGLADLGLSSFLQKSNSGDAEAWCTYLFYQCVGHSKVGNQTQKQNGCWEFSAGRIPGSKHEKWGCIRHPCRQNGAESSIAPAVIANTSLEREVSSALGEDFHEPSLPKAILCQFASKWTEYSRRINGNVLKLNWRFIFYFNN